MMFIVRSAGDQLAAPSLQIKVKRRTPEIVANGIGKTDYFCVAEMEAIIALRAAGCEVIELRDGWYADDTGGGVAISGHGKYWEIRDTKFTVREAVGTVQSADPGVPGGDLVNVRRAIFGV